MKVRSLMFVSFSEIQIYLAVKTVGIYLIDNSNKRNLETFKKHIKPERNLMNILLRAYA